MSSTTAVATTNRQQDAVQTLPRMRRRFRFAWRSRVLALIGGAIVLGVITGAAIGPGLAGFDPYRQSLAARLKEPLYTAAGQAPHLFGTDQLGRDLMVRVLVGARVSLVVAFGAVVLSAAVGISVGLLAGLRGGLADDFLMRLVDLQLAFPLILLALAMVALLGASLVNVILVFAVTSWPIYARTARASAIRLRGREFVEAARCLGCSNLAILWRHILPNSLGPLIVVGSFELAKIIIFESSLGFLGLGVQPPTPTWGNLMAEGRNYLETAWWLAFFPGLAIALTAAGINFVGDGINDLLDPRTQTPAV